jgi:hypothetical protein
MGRLALFHNGARLAAGGQTRQEGKTAHVTFDVSLIEGLNQLRATASSADGTWEAEPAEIVLQYEVAGAKSRLYLVAVGINRYADANMNLRFAANDARAITELFRRRGQAIYEQVQVVPLVDRDATQIGVREALRRAAGQTRPQDTLLVFLAGHGIMIGQRYYFLPQDLNYPVEQLEDGIRQHGLPADELSDYLGNAKALKRVMILDTCASGGALVALAKGRSFALRGAIERLSRAQGVFTIAAASARGEAQESDELGHGALSYALLAGLKAVDRGPLFDKHVQPTGIGRTIDVVDWFRFAAGEVPWLTEQISGARQQVQTSTLGLGFPVLPLGE